MFARCKAPVGLCRGPMRSKPTGIFATLCAVAVYAALLLLTRPAQAYPWMIRHHYAACSACHSDPSGAGPITAYGRAAADSVIRMNDEAEPTGADMPASAKFLLGAVRTPEWLELGGDVRVMALRQKSRGVPLTSRLIYMQLDADASISVSGFVASGVI